MTLRDAIQAYHDLLTPDMAMETQVQLDNQLRRRGLSFGSRPLVTVLRPRFFTMKEYRFLESRVRLLVRAFNKAYHAAMEDAQFRRQFGLTDWEEALIGLDPGYDDPNPTARLDAFFITDTNELSFTEYNAEVPAAVAYTDVLTELFYTLPVMRELTRKYEARPIHSRHQVLHVLLDSYYKWLGRHEAPRICILDWNDVPTYGEFVLFRDYFKANGLECAIADPRELEYRNGLLLAGDFPVTLIYKRVLWSELMYRCGMDSPVVQALRGRAVCVVNPVRCKLLHKKASLAVLSDERNVHLFNAEERQAIQAHIPWTRVVEQRHTMYRGAPIDLVGFITKYREQFVLKPNDEYGGKGIFLGWTTSQEEWERAVALALQVPHIVQERVRMHHEPYPSLIGNSVHFIERQLDTAPFVYYSSFMEGCLTRLSTEELLNVTAGGGSTVPTFLLEKR